MIVALSGDKVGKGKTVLEDLIANKTYISAPCNGKGTCGKCKVKVLEGRVKLGQNNNMKLTEEEISNGICLACSSHIDGDCVINTDLSAEDSFDVLSYFEVEPIEKNSSTIKARSFAIEMGELEEGISLTKLINKECDSCYKYSTRALRKLGAMINNKLTTKTYSEFNGLKRANLILDQDFVMDICKIEDTRILGIAVDIGTTTIVLCLVDLISGDVLHTEALLNSQRSYGADVISRIQYSSEGNLELLKKSICSDIIKGIEKLLSSDSSKEYVYHMAIAANTTMIHLLLGIPCDSIAYFPFNTVDINLNEYSFKEIFESDQLQCKVTILPGASAYVGADITAGIFKCDMYRTEKINMLIDIGTNGETVLGNKNKMLCLAAAAGPAFEGANISCGTGSVSGAVSEVKIYESNIKYTTINNAPPIGICGSGVVSITAECLKNEVVDETGRFSNSYGAKKIVIATGEDNKEIAFTQKDIRELQLAKSAIRSGIDILIEKYNCSFEDIDTVYIAGGFGNNINIESAAYIGLIPEELKSKVKSMGNTSLGGTVKYLLSEQGGKALSYIAEHIEYIDMSIEETFSKLFMENMMF